MVAYFVPRPDDLLEVTATFAPRHVDGAPFAPMRIVMGLADGDGTAFAYARLSRGALRLRPFPATRLPSR